MRRARRTNGLRHQFGTGARRLDNGYCRRLAALIDSRPSLKTNISSANQRLLFEQGSSEDFASKGYIIPRLIRGQGGGGGANRNLNFCACADYHCLHYGKAVSHKIFLLRWEL